MAVVNLEGEDIFVWIPPSETALYDVTVEREDGTIDTITDLLFVMEIEYGATENLGVFRFRIPNDDQRYGSLWQRNDIVRYYSDYATATSTLRFKGIIDRISFRDNEIEVNGRNSGLFFTEKTVTQEYTNQDVADILRDLVSKYGEGLYTTSNVPASTGIILTIKWGQRPTWDCVKDLCLASGYDCYVDPDDDFHFFLRGSVSNATDAIVHTYNLVNVGDFARDGAQVKNRVIVYGAEVDGIQVFWTAEDTESQGTERYKVREYIVNDDSIVSLAQCREVAEFELANVRNPPQTGEVQSFLLATIQPGERIYLSSPENELAPGQYVQLLYKHRFGSEAFETVVTVEKEPRKMSHVLRRRIESESLRTNAASNPFEMRYSEPYYFDVDVGSHTSTEITSGVLKLQTGQSSGTWVSPIIPLGSNVTQIYLVASAESVAGASFEVSGDGGITYQDATLKTLVEMTSSVGQSLRVRVTLTTGAQLDSLNVTYRTETITSPPEE